MAFVPVGRLSSLRGLVVERSLEQQNMRLRLVDLVVLPAQTLCDTNSAPLVLPKQLQSAVRGIVVVLGDRLEHRFGQLDMPVLILAVRVSGRVVDAVDVFLQAGALMVSKRSRTLVAAAHVNIHRIRHFCDFLPLILVAIQELLLLAEAQGRVVSVSND